MCMSTIAEVSRELGVDLTHDTHLYDRLLRHVLGSVYRKQAGLLLENPLRDELLEGYAEHAAIVRRALDDNGLSQLMEMTDDELGMLKEVSLLTLKPVIYAANVAEEDYSSEADNEYLKKIREFAKQDKAEVIVISAKIEEEIAALDKDEKQMFLEELGASESGLDKLIKASYSLLGYISYLTAGKPEVRAWTITKGTKAPQAAGKIHTDFERGFIRAEVVSFDDLMNCGSMNAAKEKGLVRSEGKDYVVKDGDIILFRFNV